MSAHVIFQALFQESKNVRLIKYECFSQGDQSLISITKLLCQVNFLKKNVPLILTVQISLIHDVEITAQKDCMPFTYHYDTREIILWFDEKRIWVRE